MRLVERFKRLSLWNKIGAVGAIASVVAIPLALILWYFSGSSPFVVNVNHSVKQNIILGQQEKDVAAAQSALTFAEIEVVPQAVNAKWSDDHGVSKALGTKERGTFRFRVSNEGGTPVTVSGADLLVDATRLQHYSLHTMARCTTINHEGHVRAVIAKATVGEAIGMPLNVVFLPNVPQDFVIWFASPDAAQKGYVLCITGRLRLRYAGGVAISKPIDMEIHSEEEAYKLRHL